MAESPAHRFGQIVGTMLEEMLLTELLRFCDDCGLYLDRHGERANVRDGLKASWEDRQGNFHDLDFVIERHGSADAPGRPIAFIEAAWRRYSKHSRNKAQEIQGAILPIAEKYAIETPFLGVVLAGTFTVPSLEQLVSHNFNIVYIPYKNIIAAFASVGIDARFNEKTSRYRFSKCIRLIEGLTAADRTKLKAAVLNSGKDQFDDFFGKLQRKLDRIPTSVTVLPLFGSAATLVSATEAVAFIEQFDPATVTSEFCKYEVSIVFSNEDVARGTFATREEALRFVHYVTS